MVLNQNQVLFRIIVLSLCVSCRGKLPSDSTLLNPPTQQQIGTIPARENLLKALMASHAETWSSSEQYFQDAYRADPHPTIVQLHTKLQQASKSVEETTEDQ